MINKFSLYLQYYNPWLHEETVEKGIRLLARDHDCNTPVLDPGIVVILDNLCTHKIPRVAQAMRNRGCWSLSLPSYSPDLKPIKMVFSKLKAHHRRIGASSFDAVFEALGDICEMFNPDECRKSLKAADYASD